MPGIEKVGDTSLQFLPLDNKRSFSFSGERDNVSVVFSVVLIFRNQLLTSDDQSK